MRGLIEAISLRSTNAQQADAQIATLVTNQGVVEVKRMLGRLRRRSSARATRMRRKPGSTLSMCNSIYSPSRKRRVSRRC